MFSDDNPDTTPTFKALENTFSTSDNAFIAIAPKGGSVFTKEALGAARGTDGSSLANASFQTGRLPHELQP